MVMAFPIFKGACRLAERDRTTEFTGNRRRGQNEERKICAFAAGQAVLSVKPKLSIGK